MERKYLPTFAELVDRLSIVMLKRIFIGNNGEYEKEIELIMNDIDVIIKEKNLELSSKFIHAVMMLMLTNRYIWENESIARRGGDGQDKLLKMTHSINGVRNTAKNVISNITGERVDLKVDCFASGLVEEFGNWNVFKK